jgi:hypothetical protein
MIKKLLLVTRPIRYYFDKLTFRTTNNQKFLLEYKDRFHGKPLLIIGNGPSLNKTPLDEFLGTPSIGMNKIDLLFDKVQWRPEFIVCTNNLVVKQHQDNFVSGSIPVFVSWKSRWFVRKKNKNKLNYFLSSASREFSKDICESLGSAGTVTYAALQFAYYMGANPVILFGVDHSFTYSGSPNDIQKRVGNDQNHFDPNYFKEGGYWGLPNLELSELGYLDAKKSFEDDGRNIYDATIGGKLEIFEKITVEEALEYVNK